MASVAEEAAHSVFSFIERAAERVADGVRWQTLDWHNQPHFTPAIFTGMGGVSFFLADYYRLTGNGIALELARGGLEWCASPAREPERDSEWEWASNGLMRGRSGLGKAWLSLHRASGDASHLECAAALGDQVMAVQAGPVTDWQDGAAGEGLFLLWLAEASRDDRFLRGATQRAAWLEEVAIMDEGGAYWPWQTDHDEHARWFGLSFVPGSAGIAHFLLSLFQDTQDGRWATLSRAAGETLLRQAVPDRGGLNWPDTLDGFTHGEERRCQWCYGAAGTALFFTTAHETLGSRNRDYLGTAVAAGECTYAYGDVRRNPSQCHGLAGSVELFLDLHRLTQDVRWLDRAAEFAKLMLSYRERTSQGDVWQSDDSGYSSPDFLYGVSGTGHTFLRLWRPDLLTRPLL